MSISEQLNAIEANLNNLVQMEFSKVQDQIIDLVLTLDKTIAQIVPALCSSDDLIRREKLARSLRQVVNQVQLKLADEIESHISKCPQPISSQNLHEATNHVRSGHDKLKKAEQLSGDSEPVLARLRKSKELLEDLFIQIDEVAKFEKLQREIKDLWETGKKLLASETIPLSVVDFFKQARTLTEEAKEQRWNKNFWDSVLLLHAEAERAYDRIRKNFEIPPTKDTGSSDSDYVGLISFFKEIAHNYPQKNAP